MELELEDAVGVGASPNEDDPMKKPQSVEGWDQVHTSGGVVLEVLVLNGHLVIPEGLLSLGLHGEGQARGCEWRAERWGKERHKASGSVF